MSNSNHTTNPSYAPTSNSSIPYTVASRNNDSTANSVSVTTTTTVPVSVPSSSSSCGTKRSSVEVLAPLNREGKNLSAKKLRRLEKNRISARECRRKKREAAQNLEREINLLESENLRLRLQLQIGDEAEKTSQKEQERLTEFLDSLLKSGASESEIYATIEEYKEKCSDYGRDRRSAIQFHLKHVERLLMPTTTTSVAMRALQGGDTTTTTTTTTKPNDCNDSKATFPTQDNDNSTNKNDIQSIRTKEKESGTSSKNVSYEPKAMFQFLVNYLEVTPEQASALKDSRSVAKELDSLLEKSVKMLQDLQQRLTDCGQDLEAEFANVRSILCPTQAAKFLVWVANNSACMHMLNELWNKVYPKPIIEPIQDSTGIDFDIVSDNHGNKNEDDNPSDGKEQESSSTL